MGNDMNMFGTRFPVNASMMAENNATLAAFQEDLRGFMSTFLNWNPEKTAAISNTVTNTSSINPPAAIPTGAKRAQNSAYGPTSSFTGSTLMLTLLVLLL